MQNRCSNHLRCPGARFAHASAKHATYPGRHAPGVDGPRRSGSVAARSALAWCLACLFVACDAASGDERAEPAEAATRVAVAHAETAAFGERLSLSGTLTAEHQAQLSARVDGLVARVHVDAGDRVEAGHLLLELDPAIAGQSLARARAEAVEAAAAVREAERLLAEAQRLIEHQVIAATELGARAATLDLARAAEASARAGAREQAEIVARHTLPAPFAGVVAGKLTEAGEWVQRGTPVLSLVATERVRLDLQVPQERFGQIDDGARVRVFADALGDEPLLARVAAQVPVTDPGARTFLLRLLVDDPQGRLRPGTSARAEIALSQTAAATVAIRRDALLRQPDGSHSIFVVEDDGDRLVARQRRVRTLHEHEGLVALAGDIVRAGERVVVRGNESLGDGQPVDVVEH